TSADARETYRLLSQHHFSSKTINHLLFVRGGNHSPCCPEQRGPRLGGPTFFLRLLVSRHPDPTQDNPLFRDKARQAFSFVLFWGPWLSAWFCPLAAPWLFFSGV